MSGRAFDNNCNCFELQNIHKQICIDSLLQNLNNNSENKENIDSILQIPPQIKLNFECVCNAPRLAPEIEFTKALISIGKKLVRIATKELKTQRLMSELAIVNMNLPARVWLPLYDFPHHIVRIPYRSAAVLNSKEKAPYIMYVEVLECDDIHCTPLPPKLLDNNLVNYSQSTNNLNTNSINEESQINNDQLSSQLDNSDQQPKKTASPKSVKSLSTDISICSAPTLLLNNSNATNNKPTTTINNINNDNIIKNDTINTNTTNNNDNNNSNNNNNNNCLSQIESDLWSVYSDSFLPSSKINNNHLNNGTNGNGMSHHNNNVKYLSSKLQSDNISIDSYMSDSRLDQASIASSSMCNITFISASEIRRRLEVDNVYTSKSGVSAIRDPDDPSMNALREPWLEKQARIRESSPYGHYPNWKLLPVIIKVIFSILYKLLSEITHKFQIDPNNCSKKLIKLHRISRFSNN
jgi:hypothetical protein